MTAASNEVVAVIQADRDIAHEIMQIVRGYRVNLPHDRHWLIDMVARHRIAHSDPRPVAEGVTCVTKPLTDAERQAGIDKWTTHSPAPMADPMTVGFAIQSAWGEDDVGFDNTLPPIEFSDAELRHLGAAAIRAAAYPSTGEGADRG